MYKKPTQPPTPNINNYKKPAKLNERAPVAADKKNQTNPNDFKNKEEQLVALVREYLQLSGYVRAYEVLKNEKPNLRAKVQLNQPQLKSQLDKNHILQLFDRGLREEFFKQTARLFHSPEEATKRLEFELNIYFCVYSIHPFLKKQAAIDKASMEAFRRYLDSKGADLSDTNEFLNFFALPYMPKPQEHKALASVLTKDWITRMRNKVAEALGNYLKSSNSFSQGNPVRKVSQLQEIYYNSLSCINSSREDCKENCSHSLEIEHLKKDNNELRMIIENYQKKFQEFTESSKINLIESNQKWFNFSREIFLLAKKHVREDKAKLVDKYSSFFLHNVDDHIAANEISIFDKNSYMAEDLSINPDLSKQKIALKRQETANQNCQIDLGRVRSLFLMAHLKDKELEVCMVLKALKHRFTRKVELLQRKEIMVEYSRGDICGVNEENYIVQKKLLFDGGERIKVLFLKLMEMMTVDRFGLEYLAKSSKLLENLVGIFSAEHEESRCWKPMLGILQRLSFSKEPRMLMIKLDIIPMMFNVFRSEANEISSFTTQFLIAMWMNLSLKKESHPAFEQHKAELIPIVIENMTNPNENIRNYVNGTIFLLLSSKQIKAEALRQRLDEFVRNLLDSKEENICTQQYNYILSKLNGEQLCEDEEDSDEEEGEEEELEDEDYGSLDDSSEEDFIEGDMEIANGEEFLLKNYALLGPDAVREQILTRSVLDETSKRLNNMTTSINRSRRIDNIFAGRGNVTVLEPELDSIFNRKKAV